MDIEHTMNIIIQKNTQNCDCPACLRWNTRALSTLVGSMEKRGKDEAYIQRQLTTIKNKDFICEKKIIPTLKKTTQSAGGVKRWRQHGHGKRIKKIPDARCVFPIHAPGSDVMPAVETKAEDKRVVVEAKEESDWQEVGPTKANTKRTKSRNKSRYEHEQGIDKIEIKVVKIKMQKKKDTRTALDKFFAKSKKKRAKKRASSSSPPPASTKTWDCIPDQVNTSPSYVKDFPNLDSDEEDAVDVSVTDKIRRTPPTVKDKFYATAVIAHIHGNISSCSKSPEPHLVTDADVCPFWSGHKGRDGCNFGKRCKLKHCKPTCQSFIATGKCTNEYCTRLHSFIATFTTGKEASDAGNIRRKMWQARKKKGGKRTFSKPPRGYTCRLCGVKGHWIQQCAKAK